MIRIDRAGLLTTVQDRGRRGVQQHGIVAAGAMDAAAHRIANVLVGNDDAAATIECTLIGPTIVFVDDAVVAITGADFGATLDGTSVPLWCPFAVNAGSTLTLGRARSGCRAYIAVGGGIDVPHVLGSRATDLIAHIGGVGGRMLAPDDVLPSGSPSDLTRRIHDRVRSSPRDARHAGRSLIPVYAPEPIVRVIRGPEHDSFTTASRTKLFSSTFQLTPKSNRMGLRLRGPTLELEGAYDLYSSPVAEGMVQVPPSGEPIVLMADHQTIGGYPRIASVITIDVPLMAQAQPGAEIRFREVSLADAQALYLAREHDLRVLALGIRLHYA